MNKWTYTTLGKISEIITGPFGSQLHQSDYVEQGIPVVMPQDIDNRKVNYASINYVSNEDAIRLERYKTIINDILYARRGDVEKHAFIKEKDNGVLCGTGCLRVRITTSEVEPEFISFFLNREETRKWLVTHAVGTNMPNLNTDILSDVPIAYPLLEEQRRIVQVLNSLDEKIALNSAVNDNLEQQLMLLYDYWFTQFDFPDNDGNPYQTSGGKMVWNDTLKRNIPENWKVQSVISNCLSSIIKPGVEIFNTKTYLATADVKGTSISTGTIVDYDGRESRANMQPSINSVWFAKMKNSIKHLYLNKEMQPIISSSILSTGFCGLQCNEISFEYIASYVSNAYFEIHKDMLAHGATQEAVNNDDLAGVHIIIPEDTVLRAYHETTQAIYAQISKNVCENQELVKLRDWLLPMLMNGQATISD
ncbi:EcoKI restriction-modification system protein HsdS [uncultured Ruminococcus sp.]|jgi:type I restriction enzyme S subunit|nr:EcoKI restriction-modification system protein HsdS [uncultured Ruminococcus sp.]